MGSRSRRPESAVGAMRPNGTADPAAKLERSHHSGRVDPHAALNTTATLALSRLVGNRAVADLAADRRHRDPDGSVQRSIGGNARPRQFVRNEHGNYWVIDSLKVGQRIGYYLAGHDGGVQKLVWHDDREYFSDPTITSSDDLVRWAYGWVRPDDPRLARRAARVAGVSQPSANVPAQPAGGPLPPPLPVVGALAAPRVPTEDERWARAKLPAANPAATNARYDFGWWFNYFYNELTTEAQKRLHLRASCTLNANPPWFTMLDQPDRERRRHLNAMRIDGSAEFVEPQVASALLGNPLELPAQMAGTLRRQDVAFRGEQRLPGDAESHGGTRAKARVPQLRSAMNMDAAWHPFSDQAVADQPLYRLGNKDNDLHTVVSVAKEFGDATKFPLIEEPETDKRWNRSEQRWTSNIVVYVVVVDTLYDTARAQELTGGIAYGAGEFAATDIGWGDILGAVHVLRYHGQPGQPRDPQPTGNDGHEYFAHKYELLQPADAIERALGAGGRNKLVRYLDSLNMGRYGM